MDAQLIKDSVETICMTAVFIVALFLIFRKNE